MNIEDRVRVLEAQVQQLRDHVEGLSLAIVVMHLDAAGKQRLAAMVSRKREGVKQ